MPDTTHQFWCSTFKRRLRSHHSCVKWLTTLVPGLDSCLVNVRSRTCDYTRPSMGDSGTDLRPAGGRTGVPSRLGAIALWNWKSALLSVAFRVPVFAIATVRHGLSAMAGAVSAEALVCAIYAGCYAGVVQSIRNRRPLWLTMLTIAMVLPALGQVLEYEVHSWRSTPHRIAAVLVSSILSVLSSLFNWYVMRHGSLLVGHERSSLSSDLRRLPVLLWRFLLLVPRWLLERVRWDVLPSS